MKIAKVESIPVRVPFTPIGSPIIAFGRPFDAFEFLLVRIETTDGIVGWGETPMGSWKPVKSIIDNVLGPAIIGREVPNVEGFMAQLQKMTYVLGRYGLTMFALSGIDTALWDIQGKAAGQPLYKLLGGAGDPVPAYISLWLRPINAFDRERSAPEVVAEVTREAVATGINYVKLHDTDDEVLRVTQETAGDGIGIMVDASCRWNFEQARDAANHLKQFNLHWLEEPLFPPEDFNALAKLQQETGVPIASGENACTSYEFRTMFEKKAVTYAQPSVTRVGGVSEFKKVLALADEHDVTVAAHSVFFGPAFIATMHLMSALRPQGLMEQAGVPLEADLYGDVMKIVEGHFRPPEGPGLGVDPNLDVLEECRIREG